MADVEIELETPETDNTESEQIAAEAVTELAENHEEHAEEAAEEAEESSEEAEESAETAIVAAETAAEAAVVSADAAAAFGQFAQQIHEDFEALPQRIATAIREEAARAVAEPEPEPPVEPDIAPEETHWLTRKRFGRKRVDE